MNGTAEWIPLLLIMSLMAMGFLGVLFIIWRTVAQPKKNATSRGRSRKGSTPSLTRPRHTG